MGTRPKAERSNREIGARQRRKVLPANGQLVSDAFQKAISSNEIQIIGDPDFGDPDSIPGLESGKDLVFSVDIEIVPGFELPELEGVPVTKPMMEVADEMIDAEVLRNQYRFGTPARITGPFEALDRMVGSVLITVEGNDEPLSGGESAIHRPGLCIHH